LTKTRTSLLPIR